MEYDATSLSVLIERLRAQLTARVRSGDLSERRLAKLAGLSQPHVHHVLAGERGLNISVADRLMGALGIGVEDLADEDSGETYSRELRAPLRAGRLGGGAPFPAASAQPLTAAVPRRLMMRLSSPEAVELSREETSMWPTLAPGDLVVLERSPAVRSRPTFEAIYALNLEGVGYLARCRKVGKRLSCVVENDESPHLAPSWVSLEENRLLDVVQGRVVWVGREL